MRNRWQQAIDTWLNSRRRQSGRNGTVRTYKCAVKQFLDWGDVPLGEVTPVLAEKWAIHLSKSLAPATVNLKLAALTSLYDYVQRKCSGLWPINKTNPFGVVERYKIDPYSRASYPTTEELKRILSAINTETLTGKRDFALILAFAVTCRRCSELLPLKWGDIEHQPMPDGNHVYRYKVLKKGTGRTQRAVLDRNVYSAICSYLEAAGRSDIKEKEYVWIPLYPKRALRLNPNLDLEKIANTPISNKTANGILKKYARRANVDKEKAHLHALRHAGARLRVEKMKENRGGTDYMELMHLLQHSSIAITQIYTEKICEEPEDPTGRSAVNELLSNVE